MYLGGSLGLVDLSIVDTTFWIIIVPTIVLVILFNEKDKEC